MARLVLKFGGTSVANVMRLEHVAEIIKKEIESGHQVAVVVSAMAGITNELVGYVHALCHSDVTPEHDVVLASGEQVTSGLLSLALRRFGLKSRSYLSWQVPIITDSSPSQAKILRIPADELESCIKAGYIPVVAGFQGMTEDKRLTTLGRGGSDTTAVALAAALKADRCDIYTDVNGVYTADPRLVPQARKLQTISYAEMFELASQGAKVLQARSVEMAMKHKVKLRVLSSFSESEGTTIVEERDKVEGTLVSGIAHTQNEAKVTLLSVPDDVGVAANIFGSLSDHQICVDMISQSCLQDGKSDLTFVLQKSDLDRSVPLLKNAKKKIGFADVVIDREVAKISIVGIGMKSNLEIAATLFKTLAEKGINIQMISTSEIRLSVVIDLSYMSVALQALHAAFNLDEKMV
jgi:aspartate kinase